jgi:hypothetical protein
MLVTSTSVRSSASVLTYDAEVTGAPLIDINGRPQLLPDKVRLRWERTNTSPWALTLAAVYGRKALPDGRTLKSREYLLFSDDPDDGQPDWLVQLITDQTPRSI